MVCRSKVLEGGGRVIPEKAWIVDSLLSALLIQGGRFIISREAPGEDLCHPHRFPLPDRPDNMVRSVPTWTTAVRVRTSVV
jgi:hypothetical protein